MAKKKVNKKNSATQYKPLKREHRMSIMLNEEEKKTLQYYAKKYKITNMARFVRTTVMTEVLRQLDKDNPTLFDQSL